MPKRVMPAVHGLRRSAMASSLVMPKGVSWA